MGHSGRSTGRGGCTAVALAGLLALAVGACSGGSNGSTAAASAAGSAAGSAAASGGGGTGPVHVKVWAWYPAFQPVVDLFNSTHTDIKIDWTNAGAGADEYTKLQTALKAGKGAPDVVMLEFQELPTIQLSKHLLNLGAYGANTVKGDYADWTWKQVSDGDKVYAIPVDAGPMAMMYRKDIFEKYQLTVPTTWDGYKAQATKLKAAAPTTFMTDFGANDGGFMHGLMWQAGAKPYTYSASKLPAVGVKINSGPAKQVMSYWQDMVTKGLADTKAFGTTDFYNGLTTGKYATYLAAGWGPGYLKSVAKSTSGKWAVAPLPQWTPGGKAHGDWGGSSFAVTDQSAHPKEATRAAMEIFGTSKDAWKIGIDQAFLFPTPNAILNWDYYQTKKYDFFGGQAVNPIFVEAYNGVGQFDWSPFNDYAFSQLTAELGKAVTARTSWSTALDTVQRNVGDYASKQGFKVTP